VLLFQNIEFIVGILIFFFVSDEGIDNVQAKQLAEALAVNKSVLKLDLQCSFLFFSILILLPPLLSFVSFGVCVGLFQGFDFNILLDEIVNFQFKSRVLWLIAVRHILSEVVFFSSLGSKRICRLYFGWEL